MNRTPTCPHCDYEFDDEETWYSDYLDSGAVYTDDEEVSDLVCPNSDCGKPFRVISCWALQFKPYDD